MILIQRLLAMIAVAVLHTFAGATEPQRPNILFVFADDWGRFASAYAAVDGPGTPNDVVQTPNVDRLAREGILFRNAFVSAPSCTPCRSALMSGQHFWRTGRGAILRGAVWDGSQPSFALLLKDAGYHIGKAHKVWSPGTPADAPYGGNRYAYEKGGGRFNQFSQTVTKMLANGTVLNVAKQALLDEVDKNFDDFLADRPAGAPFCFWFGPTNTHRKWVKGLGKSIWGIEPDSLRGKLPPFMADVPEIRQDFADYLGEAQAVDAALGTLLKKLEEIGELENTLVVASGDHGPPGFPHGKCNLYDFGSSVPLLMRWGSHIIEPGNRGRVSDDLVSLTDLAPTFLDLAGVEVPKSMTGKSLVSILKSEKSGRIEATRDAVFIGRERHVENARVDYLPYPQRAIRTHGFLYIINFHPERWPLGDPDRLDSQQPPTEFELTENTRVTLADEDAGPAKAWLVTHREDPAWKSLFNHAYGKRPREELYDLRSDPYQMLNVAAEPSFQAKRAELEKRLLGELRRTDDPRMIDDGKYFETPPLAGPVNER